ncbi:MAG: translocation/assembly module TamB domain-containing protein [Prevotella sp.]|nr:translocation/assembly module TamB domain-containing protein [Prevotella sp.]
MKKFLRWAGIVLLTPILLLVIAAVLLYVPPIQQWAVRQVAQYASQETGLSISVEHVDLSFPLDLGVDGILVTRPSQSSSTPDTIAAIGRVVADVRLLPLFSSQVVIDQLELHDANINTLDLVGDMRLHGRIGELLVKADDNASDNAVAGIDLDASAVDLNRLLLNSADISIFLSDTAAVDTTASAPWLIRLRSIDLSDSRLRLFIDSAALFSPPATMLTAAMEQASIQEVNIDLGQERYAVGATSIAGGMVAMDSTFLITQASVGLDSLSYTRGTLRTSINHGSMHEQNTGLQIASLQGSVVMDSVGLSIDSLRASTPHSVLSGRLLLPFSVLGGFAVQTPQPLDIYVTASIGRADLLPFAPELRLLPDVPLTLRARATGTSQLINVQQLNLMLPSALSLEATGNVSQPTSLSDLMSQLNVRLNTYTMVTPLLRLFGLPTGISIPAGISLTGKIGSSGTEYNADLMLSQGGGTARLKGSYDTATDRYALDLNAVQMNMRHFLPTDSIGLVSADISASGQGLDFFSPATRLQADATIHKLQYGAWNLDSITAQATLLNNHVNATATTNNNLVRGNVSVDGTLRRDSINAIVTTSLARADLHRLGVTDFPMAMGMDATFNLKSDMRLSHSLETIADNIVLYDGNGGRNMQKVELLLTTSPDTLHLNLQSGDLIARADAKGSYEQLLATATQIADSVAAQFKSRTIDQIAIKQLLPVMKLHLESRQGNPVATMLQQHAATRFKSLNVDLDTSPLTGINGEARLHGLVYDSTLIDTLRLTLVEKQRGLTFNGQITNNRRNPQLVFNLLFDGFLKEHGAMVGLRYFDHQGRLGVRVGAEAQMEGDGLLLSLVPARPTLGYKEFAVQGSNRLMLHSDLKVEADVDLLADDGTRLQLYSPEQQDSTLLQDLTISTHHVNIGSLTSAIPLLPNIQGILEGDFHLTMAQDRSISVASDMNVEHLAYEGSLVGNIGSEFVYMNREDGSHAIDGMLLIDDLPVGTLTGSLLTDNTLDAMLHLDRMPLSIGNGFIPDQIIGFEGFAAGDLAIKGKTSAPTVNGNVTLTNGYLLSEPYGLSMRFPTDTLSINNSHITLNNFNLYAYNENPLKVNGDIDFANPEHTSLNLRMTARNLMLINSKQKKKSVAYGKMFVNFGARLVTENDLMSMRGRLSVLGTTDLNYILLDSPLSTDNQMDELVSFVDFSDTTAVATVLKPAPDGFDMDLTVNVDDGAHVRCALNADQTNYVDLMGGGELRLRMGGDAMTLNGRYTIQSGSMKYSLPVIPLKTFSIQEGSYVEFTGDVFNPRLNITATERTRATVGQDDGVTRTVAFDCGVVVTRTLEDMGLEFTISAPEDMQLQSELSTMSREQKGKLAVTMLTTGMYMADGNTSAFSMNSALSSFLQNEINNITSGALKTVNLQVGLDNSTDASGQSHTDYSFSFAKRFWNNRLNVQIGGKVSTGAEAQNGQQQSFFDNVTMEYRLSPNSNQYVKLYYNQNVYDWLDGYTGEYGAGYIWRRKLNSLLDIFKVKSSTPTMPARPTAPASTTPATAPTIPAAPTLPTQPNEAP